MGVLLVVSPLKRAEFQFALTYPAVNGWSSNPRESGVNAAKTRIPFLRNLRIDLTLILTQRISISSHITETSRSVQPRCGAPDLALLRIAVRERWRRSCGQCRASRVPSCRVW